MTGPLKGCGIALRACLALGLFTWAAAGCAEPPPRPIAFAIAAQPLAQALAEYSLASGLTVLVDSALTEGRHAPAVVGNYSAGDALRKLLAGSSLAIRYASRQSFTLVAEPGRSAQDAARQSKRLRDTQYATQLQAAVKRALCAARGAEPGSYRALVQLWFDKAWSVSRISWVTSTGSPRLDGRLEAALRGVAVGPMPAGMPQPVTLLLEPRSAGDCDAMAGAGRAG
ncbi:STN domain-containing protein [Achromobacter seleniivolatilans]|uniref:STN domain-containing protein n=1 Tax=Achromobacter seleniivolatilans TaxID=3047478 RepID=A0ABY9M1F8_9BURK|nr:STN domain-containing protein [Achromobacter sp. R39]WMD20819.1 STN domain-containing protein [Achromobacter sp. R39]